MGGGAGGQDKRLREIRPKKVSHIQKIHMLVARSTDCGTLTYFKLPSSPHRCKVVGWLDMLDPKVGDTLKKKTVVEWL